MLNETGLYGVGGKLLLAVRVCTQTVKHMLSEWFLVKVGLRQGCVCMIPRLFYLYTDRVVKGLVMDLN